MNNLLMYNDIAYRDPKFQFDIRDKTRRRIINTRQ